MKGNVIWALLIVGVFLGFLVGLWYFKTETKTEFINNPQSIKAIAELSTLEIESTAEYSESNLTENKSIWYDMRDYFTERTILLKLPYQAKFGIQLTEKEVKIKRENNTTVLIEIPKPTLLSFSPRLDRMNQYSKNGAFVFQKDNKFLDPLKKLYSETESKLKKDSNLIQQSEEKVIAVLKKIYQPLNVDIQIKFVK